LAVDFGFVRSPVESSRFFTLQELIAPDYEQSDTTDMACTKLCLPFGIIDISVQAIEPIDDLAVAMLKSATPLTSLSLLGAENAVGLGIFKFDETVRS
jgi:hypothetical protein